LFLPGGLTTKDLMALDARLSASIYSRTQRLELGDRLIECAVLGLILEYPDVINDRLRTPEARERATQVLVRVAVLEELGAICDGRDNPDQARSKIFAALKGTAYLSLGANEEFERMQNLAVSTADSRGATSFLAAM